MGQPRFRVVARGQRSAGPVQGTAPGLDSGSVNFEIQVPRVLRLLHYDRVPKQRVRLNRRNIFARDSNHCQYCGKRFATSELSLDHIVPDLPRRRHVVGKPGLRVREVQRPQRRAHAVRSGHQADQAAVAAEDEPAADDQARQPEIRQLEDVPGQRLLVGGFEVARSTRSGARLDWSLKRPVRRLERTRQLTFRERRLLFRDHRALRRHFGVELR